MNSGSAILHYLKFLGGIEEAETQTTVEEQKLIAKYAHNAKTAVEIGVFEGVNTLAIANSIASDALLYAIDPFFKGKLGICYGKHICKIQLTRAGVKNKVKLLEMFSHHAVSNVKEPIDFIFVDGDHSLDGIIKDWEDWSPKVRIGGYIALHDTSIPAHDDRVSLLGSYQYFQSHIKKDTKFKIVDQTDSLNILQKIV